MEREKFVDESWKEAASQEKERLESLVKQKTSNSPRQSPEKQEDTSQDEHSQESENPTDTHFMNYVSSLAYQAMIFLGEIPHPMTNEIEKNLEQSKFLIDTLVMLRDKTKGNLNKQETDILNTSAYELQMKYVEITQKERAV